MEWLVSPHDLGDLGKCLFECDTQREGRRDGAKKGALQSASTEQYGEFQSPPQSAVRLSCAEIRKLFWQLVLLVERKAAAVLKWSSWRRWHQAWARYYHYRRRAARMEPDCSIRQEETPGSNQPNRNGPSELVEQLWQCLQPLLADNKRGGRPYSHQRRVVVEAIVYQMQSGCAWNGLPSHFPPYQTVHAQLRNWQKTGIWAKAWDGLGQPCSSE